MPSTKRLPLAKYEGEQRVLLIAADSADDAEYRQQKAMLESHKEATEARDLVIVTAIGEDRDNAELREAYRLPEAGFAVALIGKDGQVEDRLDRPMDVDYLLGTIDRFPQRQEEMEERGESEPIDDFFKEESEPAE